jgi:hypothetical protein
MDIGWEDPCTLDLPFSMTHMIQETLGHLTPDRISSAEEKDLFNPCGHLPFLRTFLWRVRGFNNTFHPSPDIKLTRDKRLYRFGDLDEISKDSIHGIFVEDS